MLIRAVVGIALIAFGILALARRQALRAAMADWPPMSKLALSSYVLPPFLIAYGTVRIESSIAAIIVVSSTICGA